MLPFINIALHFHLSVVHAPIPSTAAPNTLHCINLLIAKMADVQAVIPPLRQINAPSIHPIAIPYHLSIENYSSNFSTSMAC